MVGRIMPATKAKQEYGFDSIRKKGEQIALRNTSGKPVTVNPSQLVYHRGNENFGIYSETRDKHRISSGSDRKHVGTGSYRQTSDRKRR